MRSHTGSPRNDRQTNSQYRCPLNLFGSLSLSNSATCHRADRTTSKPKRQPCSLSIQNGLHHMPLLHRLICCFWPPWSRYLLVVLHVNPLLVWVPYNIHTRTRNFCENMYDMHTGTLNMCKFFTTVVQHPGYGYSMRVPIVHPPHFFQNPPSHKVQISLVRWGCSEPREY